MSDTQNVPADSSDFRPDSGSLPEWIARVREKFSLPQTEDQHFKSPYWDGYEACLRDLEKFLSSSPL